MAPLPQDFWELLEVLVKIGAPSNQEERRILFIQEWLTREIPLPLHKDDTGSLLLDMRSDEEISKAVPLIDAHVDTVFLDLQVSLKKEAVLWHAPGISDNTCSVALLMVLARELFQKHGNAPLLLSWTTGEESIGNLRGIRKVLSTWQDSISMVLALDLDLEQFSLRGPGSSRFSFLIQGEGGHSWKNFGTSNPLLLFTKWAERFQAQFTWKPAEDTFNIQMQTDRAGVSSIPTQLEGEIELRSLHSAHLHERTKWLKDSLAQSCEADGLLLTLKDQGSRPAGISDRKTPLYQALEETHQEMGLALREVVASTNINLPSSLGIPSLCTGLYVRNGVHSRQETLDITTVPMGWNKLLKTVHRLIE